MTRPAPGQLRLCGTSVAWAEYGGYLIDGVRRADTPTPGESSRQLTRLLRISSSWMNT